MRDITAHARFTIRSIAEDGHDVATLRCIANGFEGDAGYVGRATVSGRYFALVATGVRRLAARAAA